MRINRIVCPACKTSLTSKAGIEEGTSIACPKCKKPFAVAAPEEEIIDDFEVVDDEDETPKKKPAPRKPVAETSVPNPFAAINEQKPAARKRDNRTDDEEDRPMPKKRRPVDDEEEDRPRAKKRGRDDDDERPRRKKKRRQDDDSAYGKLKGNIWVRVGVLGSLLAILGVLGYLLYDKQKHPKVEIVVEKNEEEDLGKPIDRSKIKVNRKEKEIDRSQAERKAFVSAQGRFKVQFPGIPEEKIEQIKGSTLRNYGFRETNGSYVAGFSEVHIPADPTDAQKGALLDEFCEAFTRGIGGTLKNKSTITLNNKYPGRELSVSGIKGENDLLGRFYLVDRTAYQVFVIGRPAWVNSPAARKFLDSFELTK